MATYRQILPALLQQLHSKINFGEIHDILHQSTISFCVTYGSFNTSYQTEIIDGLTYYDYRIDKACNVINELKADFDLVTASYKKGDVTTTNVDNEVTSENTTTNSGNTKVEYTGTSNITADKIDNAKSYQYPDGYLATADTNYIDASQDNTSNATSENNDTATTDNTSTNDTNSEGKDKIIGTTTVSQDKYNQHYYETQLSFQKRILDVLENALLSLQVVIGW